MGWIRPPAPAAALLVAVDGCTMWLLAEQRRELQAWCLADTCI